MRGQWKRRCSFIITVYLVMISSLLQMWIKILLLMIQNSFLFWIKTKIHFRSLILLFSVPFYPTLPSAWSEVSWIELPAIWSWCNHHNATNMYNNFISWRPYFESKLNWMLKQNFSSLFWHHKLFHFYSKRVSQFFHLKWKTI